MRKQKLARLLTRRPDGFVAPFEQGEIGPDLFEAAGRMGLKGMVSNPVGGYGYHLLVLDRAEDSQPLGSRDGYWCLEDDLHLRRAIALASGNRMFFSGSTNSALPLNMMLSPWIRGQPRRRSY